MTTAIKHNNYENEYLSGVIDVYINWMQFLNKYSYEDLKYFSEFELMPMLEKIRSDLYSMENIIGIKQSLNATNVNVQVELGNFLAESKYPDLLKYLTSIQKNLSWQNVNNLCVALFIRKFIEINYQLISLIINDLDKSYSLDNLLLKDLLEKLVNNSLVAKIKKNDLLPLNKYLETLRIQDGNNSLLGYLYYNFLLIEKMCSLLNLIFPDMHKLDDDINILIEDIEKNGMVSNISCLIDSFEMLDSYFNEYIKNHKLEKQPKTLQLAVKTDN